MKKSLLCFMMGSGMAFNAMAALDDTKTGGAFNVLAPKVSNGQKVEGCPTIETPLLLTFEHNFQTEWFDMYFAPDEYYNPWKMNIKAAHSYEELKNIDHEVHIYIELYDLPNGKFASNDIFSYYDADENIIVTNGKNVNKWHKLSDKKYKLVLPLSSESSAPLAAVYALSRNFRTLEMFHFQSVTAEWDLRSDYAESKKMVSQMLSSSLSYYLLDNMMNQIDGVTKSLYLYQKLSRSTAKDTNVSFEQKRGYLYPRSRLFQPGTGVVITDGLYKLNGILLGGRDLQRYANFYGAARHEYDPYPMSDKDSFKNYLKLESFDFKLFNGHALGTAYGMGYQNTPRLNLAQYNSSEFKMTKENAQLCGLN